MSRASRYLAAVPPALKTPAGTFSVRIDGHLHLPTAPQYACDPCNVTDNLSPRDALALADWIRDTFGDEEEEVR
jgi:hypothetical protein